jgi:oxygen-independent coproporphyrinogen-3 oxidase
MVLHELQVSLTNKCEIGCPYCYKCKEKPIFLSEDQITKILTLAKSLRIPAIRYTGGDIFEHPNLLKILERTKNEGLNIISNISIKRIDKVKEIVPYSNYILFSFQNGAQVAESSEELTRLIKENPQVKFMACAVFQNLEASEKLLEEVKIIPLNDFFFLRNVNESRKEYLLDLVKLSEILIKQDAGRIKNKIKIANAFPLCYVSMKAQEICDGGLNDDGKSFVYINENGDIKPNSYSKIFLGNIEERDIGSKLEGIIKICREKCEEVINLNYYCKKCKIKEKCHGGIIAKETYSKDPLTDYQKEFITDHKLMSNLQKNLINFLPNTEFKADPYPLYFRHSDFFMQYPTENHWKQKSSIEELKDIIKKSKKETALYIHLPFCNSRCKFCSVKKYPNEHIESYIQFILGEIENLKEGLESANIKYIYFGGGTPSIIGKANLERIFEKLYSIIKKEEIEEVTIEAFPSNFDEELYDFLKNKVTRVSIGVQSLNNETLKKFCRPSTKEEISKFIKSLQPYPFTKSIDMIYGLYLNNPDELKKDLNEIISLNLDQVTYQPLHNDPDLTESDEIFFLKKAKTLDRINKIGREVLRKGGYSQYTAEDFNKEGRPKFLYQLNLLNQGNVLGIGINTYSFIENTYFYHESKNEWRKFKLEEKQMKIDKISKSIRLMSSDKIDLEIYSDSISYLQERGLIELKSGRIEISEEGKNYLDLISQILVLNNFDYKIR